MAYKYDLLKNVFLYLFHIILFITYICIFVYDCTAKIINFTTGAKQSKMTNTN